MKCLNSSYKAACLQCSFTDKELAEYIHYKKRNAAHLPRKYAVTVVGKEPDGSWVFSSDVHLTYTGDITDPASSEYTWIGHVLRAPGVAVNAQQCNIELPLTTDPLCALLQTLRVRMCHNFIPSCHDNGRNSSCTALLNNATETQILSCSSCIWRPWYGQNYCLTVWSQFDGRKRRGSSARSVRRRFFSFAPPVQFPKLGVDDPQSKNDISRLIIDLYNGARSGTVGRGEAKPTSTCVISANFTTLEQQR